MTVTLNGVESGDVAVSTINSVSPQFDDTDKLAVSLYGKGSAAGDSELETESASNHNLRVALYSSASKIGQAENPEDSNAALPNNPQFVHSVKSIFNGTAWDRERSNEEATLLASAARTATANSADQTNYNGRGLLVYVDVTVDPAAASITPSLQVKDSIGGGYFTIWTAAAALTATGDAVYYFGDGVSGGSFTESLPFGLPARTWRLAMTHADADSITYSVSAVVLL